MSVQRLDHVGIVVDDLAAARSFFESVGLVVEGEARIEGEWVDNVIGLRDVHSEMVLMRTPDGTGKIEISKFLTPVDDRGADWSPSNRLGIRHLSFAVDDLDSILERLRNLGFDTVGTVENFEDIYRLCYIRGPEGIIVELAEELAE
jgi:catechol 2,3-dioxygenase-like lactoylglutathione lyase family enzyme